MHEKIHEKMHRKMQPFGGDLASCRVISVSNVEGGICYNSAASFECSFEKQVLKGENKTL